MQALKLCVEFIQVVFLQLYYILSSGGSNLVRMQRFLRPTRDRRIRRPLENNELINENQSRPCLLEKDSRVYTCIRTLSTCAHVSMRMISHDRYRRCFARVPPCTHACTHLRTRTSSIFICAGTFDAWHHLARRTDRAAALRLQLTVQYSTRRVSRSAIKQKINEIQSWKIHIFSRMYDSRNTWKKIFYFCTFTYPINMLKLKTQDL